MLNKISIKTKITLTTVLLLTICCIGLTLVLNKSAFRMVDEIEPAVLTQPTINKNLSTGAPYRITQNILNLNELEIVQQSTIAETAKISYRNTSTIYMICFIGFGGLLAYIITDISLKPLNELSNQMKNKNVDNLSKEIYLGKNEDEIHELTKSFNIMNKKLNEAFLMQKRFSHNAAHELRTPLAIMRTKLDVFKKRKNPSEEDYNKLIESIRNQVVRLSDIVNSLLSLTNMDNIDLSQSINLKTLIEHVCKELYYISEKKHININILCEDMSIKGNYDLIYRVFYNLIENSIKYNYEYGSVDISTRIEEKNKVTIDIKDSGIGIPNDMKENIFEPFFTVDKSRSRKLGGAGIGLSIVKSIIDNHKGSIKVKDNEQGGSIFIIKFNI